MDKSEAIDLLHRGGYSCVVVKEGRAECFRRRGVTDLFLLLRDRPEALKGAFVADKVVGRGAAMLMVCGGVGELYTDLISEQALPVLAAADITVAYNRTTPHILNRQGTDWCPVEELCRDLQLPEEGFLAVGNFLNKTGNSAL